MATATPHIVVIAQGWPLDRGLRSGLPKVSTASRSMFPRPSHLFLFGLPSVSIRRAVAAERIQILRDLAVYAESLEVRKMVVLHLEIRAHRSIRSIAGRNS